MLCAVPLHHSTSLSLNLDGSSARALAITFSSRITCAREQSPNAENTAPIEADWSTNVSTKVSYALKTGSMQIRIASSTVWRVPGRLSANSPPFWTKTSDPFAQSNRSSAFSSDSDRGSRCSTSVTLSVRMST
eukprot:2724533-Rhodomonas_salina.3